MQTDSLFYRLFQEFPSLAFDLVGRPPPEDCSYRMHAEEVKQTTLRLDGVLVPDTDQPDVPLVFSEAQFYPDPDFYQRWFSGIFLYIYRQRVQRSWWAVVVYPDRATDVAAMAPFQGLIDSGFLHRVYLEDLLDETLDQTNDPDLGRRLVRLVVLDREHTPAEARSLAEAAAGFPPVERFRTLDLIETILVYKLSELSREEIQAMLHLPVTDVTKTRYYREVFSEGQKEGHDEGQKAMALNLVLRLLRRRFGAVTPSQEQRLQALSADRLADLGEALLAFQGAEDLDAWLDAHPRQ